MVLEGCINDRILIAWPTFIVLIGLFCWVMITSCFPKVVLIGMIAIVVPIGWFSELGLIIIHLMSRRFSHDETMSWNIRTGIRQDIRVLRLLLAGLVPVEDEEEEEKEERHCRCKQIRRDRNMYVNSPLLFWVFECTK